MSEQTLTSDKSLNYLPFPPSPLKAWHFRTHGFNVVNTSFGCNPDRAVTAQNYLAKKDFRWAAVAAAGTVPLLASDWKAAGVTLGLFALVKAKQSASNFLSGRRYAREWRQETARRGNTPAIL